MIREHEIKRLKAVLSRRVTKDVQELTQRLVPPSDRGGADDKDAGITAPPDIILDEVAPLRAYHRYCRMAYRPPFYSPADEALVRSVGGKI